MTADNDAPETDAPSDKPKAKPETDDATDKRPDDVEAMKRALKKANKEAEEARLKVKEFEDRDKSESEKAAEKLTAAESRAADAEARALRLEVAFEKGLTPAQAKRLMGATRDELEADADELLDTFGSTDRPEPPTSRPKERPRGGSDPEEDPAPDIRKIVDSIEPAI